jgi:hypothetical protein
MSAVLGIEMSYSVMPSPDPTRPLPAHELAQQRHVPVIPTDVAINARAAEKPLAVEPPFKPVDVSADVLPDNKHKAQTLVQAVMAILSAALFGDKSRITPCPQVPAQQALANRIVNEAMPGGSGNPDLRA